MDENIKTIEKENEHVNKQFDSCVCRLKKINFRANYVIFKVFTFPKNKKTKQNKNILGN